MQLSAASWHVSAGPLIRISLAALSVALVGIGLADRLWVLAVALTAGGALVGTLDTAMLGPSCTPQPDHAGQHDDAPVDRQL